MISLPHNVFPKKDKHFCNMTVDPELCLARLCAFLVRRSHANNVSAVSFCGTKHASEQGKMFYPTFPYRGKSRDENMVRATNVTFTFSHTKQEKIQRTKKSRNMPRRTLMRRPAKMVGWTFFTHYLALPLTQTRFDHIFFHALVLVFVLICFNTFSKCILNDGNGPQLFRI